MSTVEWNHWISADELARMPEVLAEPARTILPMVGEADLLDLTYGEFEVVPGVRLMPAPGHTIGHCVVMLESGGQQRCFSRTPYSMNYS
jgi:glyoxylase-like metal-dependent hydrolase (beta-lactamase superfamily II)